MLTLTLTVAKVGRRSRQIAPDRADRHEIARSPRDRKIATRSQDRLRSRRDRQRSQEIARDRKRSHYSQLWALRNCNVKKTRRELSRWELRNRATRADTLSKRAVHVQPPQLSTACLRRPQHELREQRQHCTSSSTQIEPSMWAMTSTAVNACGVVLRRIGHRGRPCSWRGGGGGVKPLF